jgi:transposase-like protein
MPRERTPKPLTVQPTMTLTALMERFNTEDACKAYLHDQRWRDGVVKCPRCGNDKVSEVKKRPWHWQCRKCQKNGYRFSIITHTIFENTKYPLRTWFQVAYLMSQSKKGISALQIHRQIGSGSYETAWYMCTRIRAAMKGDALPLTGQVEVDETFLGGKQKNRHANVRAKYHGGGAANTGKMTVIGAISRKGNVVCQVIENTSAETLSLFVEQTVNEKVSLVATDEYGGYRDLKHFYPHETVDHKAREYVRGEVHTNSIENFWSLLKRGVVGTFHNVSKDYLPLYLNEFSFRFNERNNPDIFAEIIRSV